MPNKQIYRNQGWESRISTIARFGNMYLLVCPKSRLNENIMSWLETGTGSKMFA